MSEAQMNGAVPSSATQTIFTNDSRVACNGGGGPLGHPQVWLNLSRDGQVTCPYCSRHFLPLPRKLTIHRRAATPKIAAAEGPTMQEKQQLLLVDGSGYIFRAFHALPPMT